MVDLLPRITVDFERLMKALLTHPGLTVHPRVDVSSLDKIPLLTYVGGNGHMISNGHPAAGWEWTLFLSLFADSIGGGTGLADTVYQLVHGLEDRTVPGVGSVSSVEDVSMFDRVGGASFADKQIIQFNATFTVRVCH